MSDKTLWLSNLEIPNAATTLEAIFGAIFAEQSITVEYLFRCKNGNLRWISSTYHSQHESTRNSWLVAAVSLDISDRKQAELRLRTSEERFSTIFRASPDAISIVTFPEGVFVDVNDRFLELIGYSRSEIIGQSTQQLRLWVDLAERAQLLEQLQQQRAVRNLEFDLRVRSGAIRTVLFSAELIHLNQQPCILTVSRDITDRKQTERMAQEALEREQRAIERERFIARIAQSIRQSLDLNQILTTTVEQVRQFLQVDRVVIYQFQPDWNGRIVAEALSQPEFSIADREIHDPCFRASMAGPYQDGRIHVISDIDEADLDPCYAELLASLNVRAVLVIPVLVQQNLWGLLVAHQCNRPRRWQQLNWLLLQQLSTQLAIGIYQAELYQEVQQLNSSLERQVEQRTEQLQQALEFEALLKRITDRVRDSIDERQILQSAVQELGQELDLDCCEAALYDLDARLATIRYEYLRNGIRSALDMSLDMNELPELYRQILQRQPVHFTLLSLPETMTHAVESDSTILCCPLMDDQVVFGDLCLFRPRAQHFSPSEIRLVQQVASQCAIAVRQARLYEAAQSQVRELERLSHLKDDFLSSVSHELRTPISTMKLAIQMLGIQLSRSGILSNTDSPVNRYFQILQTECQREINLINNLLDLSRMDEELPPLAWTVMDVRGAIVQIAQPFFETARTQQQQLQIDIPEDLPSVALDLSYLERILVELLTNACKYSPVESMITVSAAIISPTSASEPFAAESAPTARPTLRIQISNTGVEIAPDEFDRIFEKFYRIPNRDPWQHSGTGLGLALVKRLVEHLQGNIHVESGSGQTAFIMTLPLPENDLQ